MRLCPRPLGIALLCGCAARSAPPQTPVLAPAPSESIPDATPPGAPADDYAGLVRQVASGDEGSGAGGTAQCVIERIGDRLRYGAHARSAIRPLPMPSADLDAQLALSVSVNVLTGYGRYGSAPATLTLAAFSPSPPTREALALVVTDGGIALRGVNASVPLQNQLTRDAAVEAALRLQPATVFVAAEAQVSTPRLAELLSALAQRHVPVALAVDLPADAVVPRAKDSSVAACPEGLPASDEPEGDLALPQIKPAIAELAARASDCLSAADARGAAGGRVRVMLRVGADGQVTQACISADETGDAKVLACILAQARAQRFPPPAPRGSVDLELPLALTPANDPAVPLLCDALPTPRPVDN